MFVEGSSFWVSTERYDSHLYFIISDPTIDDESVVYVNITSYDSNARESAQNDPACLIHPGDHPFVKHLTCVYYFGAQVASISHLSRRDNNGQIKRDEPASPQLLNEKRRGAAATKFIEYDVLEILDEQGVLPVL